MIFPALTTFGEQHLAMEKYIASLPDSLLAQLKNDCEATTRTNCAWYVYQAARWIAPAVESALRDRQTAADLARSVGESASSRVSQGEETPE